MAHELSRVLAELTSPGSFATRRTAAAGDLRLEVKGVGPVELPVSSATARKLRDVARPASYGFKDQTRFDRRVRDAWEIPKRRISIDQSPWKETLRLQLDGIRRDLGLPDGCRLKATLHNMLVYEPGQFFLTHQDSEKAEDMIGTLVVILPSDFAGGALALEHHGDKVTFRGSPDKLTFIAFYTDCRHQVRPTTRGHRVVLTYNLIVEGDATVERPAGEIKALARSVNAFFQMPPAPRWANDSRRDPPDRLVYLLDHEYTQRGLAWNRLKNADVARVAALRDVAKQLDCEIFLALADVHETWSCEDDEGDAFYGHRRGYWAHGNEDDHEDGGEDAGADGPSLGELYDSDVELRHWIGLTGRAERIADRVEGHEVCYTKASVDMKPFASEHEGYTGNAGNTVDRWYHRAAVVMWPRERTFVIRAKASAAWAIGEVAKTLSAGKPDEARQMTERIVPFWKEVAQREEGRDFVDQTLGVAVGIDHADLAACLLEPFVVPRLTSRTASRLAELLDRYGVEWCQSLVGRWTSGQPHEWEKRAIWLVGVPILCRRLCAHDLTHALDLARWLVGDQWTWLVKQRQQLLETVAVKYMLEGLSKLNKPVLALLESAGIVKGPDLLGEMVSALTLTVADFPVRVHIHLLRAADQQFSRAALPALGLKPVHTHVMSDLTARLRVPARAKDDWSIPAPNRCGCAWCGTLAQFLRAPDRVRFDWPLAKDRRSHVHGILDAHDLPVSHTTRRTGSPFTLVLVKTDALFQRDAAERESWQRDVDWLATTADAF